MGVGGWSESPIVFDSFPGVPGMGIVAEPQTYAVGCVGSKPLASRQKRTGPDRGIPTHTDVRVRLLGRIRGDGQVASYDEGLEAEALFADAVIALNSNPDLSLVRGDLAMNAVWEGIVFSRAVVDSAGGAGLMLVEHQFQVLHQYPLGAPL